LPPLFQTVPVHYRPASGRVRVELGMNYHIDWAGTHAQLCQSTALLLLPALQWHWLPLKVLLVVILALLLLVRVTFG
jgi:hypothetical protein